MASPGRRELGPDALGAPRGQFPAICAGHGGLYDVARSDKEYRAQAPRLHAWIRQYARRPARRHLDVACRTGRHAAELRPQFIRGGLAGPGLCLGIRPVSPAPWQNRQVRQEGR